MKHYHILLFLEASLDDTISYLEEVVELRPDEVEQTEILIKYLKHEIQRQLGSLDGGI